MKKVLTTTEMVRLHEANNDADWINQVLQYADLMRQPLQLPMFVPCVDGKPIEKPVPTNSAPIEVDVPLTEQQAKDVNAFTQYQKAKEQVLFDGCEIVHQTHCTEPLKKGDNDNSLWKGEILIQIKKGSALRFSRKTGKQISLYENIEALARKAKLKPTQAFIDKVGL